MTALRSLAFAALAAPLALTLAACGSKDDATSGASPTAGPIATVPAPAGQQWSDVVSATDGGRPSAPQPLALGSAERRAVAVVLATGVAPAGALHDTADMDAAPDKGYPGSR